MNCGGYLIRVGRSDSNSEESLYGWRGGEGSLCPVLFRGGSEARGWWGRMTQGCEPVGDRFKAGQRSSDSCEGYSRVASQKFALWNIR